ncbi:MAG TPA: hypothetical protein VEX35_12960 [Allosphingosinicella sp.]|nr:hypothetical protein [Allosphingosinicella sp.]
MTLTLALLLAAAQPPGLDARVEQRLAADPALRAELADSAEHRRELVWMIGGWTVHKVRANGTEGGGTGFGYGNSPFHGAWIQTLTTFPDGVRELRQIGYDPVGRRWISVTNDSRMNVYSLYAPGWENGRAVFEGDVVILGIQARVRQTIERRGENEYSVTNEELLDGRWRRLDSYLYTSRPVN